MSADETSAGMTQSCYASQPREAVAAYVGLGANLGDALAAFRRSIAALRQLPGTRLDLCSSVYKTAALETHGAQQPDYLNAVVKISTDLSAPLLLGHLLRIEQASGRERPYHHAPRTLDLDLLLYGSATINSADLTVPHPRLWTRAFVLVPLHEIAPQLVKLAQLEAVAGQMIERLGDIQV